MREFNSLDAKRSRGQVQPLVYGTFQAYLRRYLFFLEAATKSRVFYYQNNRTPAHLALALADARTNNYALGVKLVRGAYHSHEITAHRAAAVYDEAAQGNSVVATARPSLSISQDLEPPVWMEKRETDAAYNECLELLIKEVKEDVKRCEKSARYTVVEGNTMVTKNGWFGLYSSGGAGISAGSTDKKKLKTTTALAPSIGVLFGTHNWNSCGLVLKNLVDAGLAVTANSNGHESKPEVGDLAGIVKISDDAVERISIGQLYGAFDF